MDQTIDYYNLNAENFIENTQNVDMHQVQDKFLHLLNDGSAKLCRLASSFTCIAVQEMLQRLLIMHQHYILSMGVWI